MWIWIWIGGNAVSRVSTDVRHELSLEELELFFGEIFAQKLNYGRVVEVAMGIDLEFNPVLGILCDFC